MTATSLDENVARLESPWLGVSTGLFLFEALSGAAITIRPALDPLVESGVLLHTAAGLALGGTLAVYTWRHWLRTRESSERRMVWIGSAAAVAVGLSWATGAWAAGASWFGDRLPAAARACHAVTSYAAMGLVCAHLAVALSRLRRMAGAGARWRSSMGRLRRWSVGTCAAAVAASWALAGAARAPRYRDGLPPGYSLPYGGDPFAPSNAATASGSAYDARRLAGSKRCGDCHAEIYKEWKASAHHWSSTDPAYRAVEKKMIAENGRAATRYCAGCHDPVGLLSGQITPGSPLHGPGTDEGSSCLVCHSIRAKSGPVRGNGGYVVSPPRDYLFAGYETGLGRDLNYFLIRAMPAAHRQDLARGFYHTPEFCASCHKQFIDKEVNHFGWVQLQNQYDDWRKGHYHVEGHPEKTLSCRDCHMRLADSPDPAQLNGAFHRSHRFIAANQAIPRLRGDREQLGLTIAWLQGRARVPEIASRWAKGAAVPIKIEAPESAAPGGPLEWQVVVTNNKVGHSFPTGPLDLIETWLDVAVRDAHGRELYRSGFLDGRNYVDKNAVFFRSLGVSKEGRPINRHNLWDMVGQKSKRSIFVGFSDAAWYSTRVPRSAAGPLTISARLRYRKFNQFVTDWVAGHKGLRLPITDLSWDTATVELPSRSAKSVH